jgi:hypothetical protein
MNGQDRLFAGHERLHLSAIRRIKTTYTVPALRIGPHLPCRQATVIQKPVVQRAVCINP